MFAAPPRVVYISPHVPAEWIAAHGLAPCRITPRQGLGEAYAGMGVCPYAAAARREAAAQPDAVGVILTTSCDQMRRQSEVLAEETAAPVLLMHIPTAVEAPTALPVYRDETLRLGRFLEQRGGTTPTTARLAETMAAYETARTRLLETRVGLSARAFSEALLRFQQGDMAAAADIAPRSGVDTGVPLALVGAPLRHADLCIFDEIEEAGGRVVLDATTSGERGLPPRFDPQSMHESPLDALLDAYLHLPDAFQRPNTRLYAWLRRETQARGVRGILLRHYVWCDLWRMEAARMAEIMDLPILHLDIGEEEDSARQAGRIQAFLEALS